MQGRYQLFDESILTRLRIDQQTLSCNQSSTFNISSQLNRPPDSQLYQDRPLGAKGLIVSEDW